MGTLKNKKLIKKIKFLIHGIYIYIYIYIYFISYHEINISHVKMIKKKKKKSRVDNISHHLSYPMFGWT